MNKKSKLLIIVPNLPPAINGVGDYALLLAKGLKEKGVEGIVFLVAGNPEYTEADIEGIQVLTLKNQNATSLFNMVCKYDIIHLHYVGYGYAKRGAPVWLLKGLQHWNKTKSTKLITTFHELYATSNKPWQSSFWLSLLQKYICKGLAILSNEMITSTNIFASRLEIMSVSNLIVLPVFSNIGEPADVNLNTARYPHMVVFGSKSSRQKTYDRYTDEINEYCKKLSIHKVIDIGMPLDHKPAIDVEFAEKGVLPNKTISDILSESTYGFIGAYDSRWFAKSGVFAAYASYGNVVLNGSDLGNIDGLCSGVHYIAMNNLSKIQNDAKHITVCSESIYQWYDNHRLNKHINYLLNCFQNHFS